MIDLVNFRTQLVQVVNRAQENLATIRTGRATSALIENLIVTTYGGEAKLKVIELATINNEGPQTLLVTPFDPSVIADLEKALRESSLSFFQISNHRWIKIQQTCVPVCRGKS